MTEKIATFTVSDQHLTGKKNLGKPPGTKNLISRDTKKSIEETFRDLGGWRGLSAWAREHQTEFYTQIWTKIIPKNIHLSGDPENPVSIRVENILGSLPTEDLIAFRRTMALLIPKSDQDQDIGDADIIDPIPPEPESEP